MARIRSVHPSLFTDESWVSCSPLARVLYIGLMTEADDQGLFEWKPLQIKMRLLPIDNADVPSLLEELVAVNLIARLESAGKNLGAIRYFRRFQRPKKPTSQFSLPVEWRTYVGLSEEGSEPDSDDEGEVPNQFPTSGEGSPQMEDGGGRKKEKEDADASLSPPGDGKPEYPDDFEACWRAYPHVKGRSSKSKALTWWRKISAGRRALMLGAVERYAREGREPREDCGAPAMDRWLREQRYLDWLQPAAAEVALAWDGPAEVREAVEAGFGDAGRAVSFLRACRWDEARRAIVSDNGFSLEKIRDAAGPRLNRLGVKLILEKGRAA